MRKDSACCNLYGVWLLFTSLAGCGEQVPPEVASLRSQFILAEEPIEAITIDEARELVAEVTEEIVLILRVGNRKVTTWSSQDEAVFFASEGYPDSDYNIGADHDPSTCPFCKWKWKDEDSMAVWEVIGDDGEPAPYPAEQIFNCKPEDFIVIARTSHLDEDGLLNVKAVSSISVSRFETA